MKVNVINSVPLPESAIKEYIDYAVAANPGKRLTALDIELKDGGAELTYHYGVIPFDRIRRITGYLVGTLDRFNNAKRAEVEDRVKHGLSTDSSEDVYLC